MRIRLGKFLKDEAMNRLEIKLPWYLQIGSSRSTMRAFMFSATLFSSLCTTTYAGQYTQSYSSLQNRADIHPGDLIPMTCSGSYGIVGYDENTDTVVNALNELWTGLQTSLITPNTSTV